MQTLTQSRGAMFGAFGLLNGMLVADYLHYVHMYVGSQVIPTAFFASVSIFACFSVSALVAKQRYEDSPQRSTVEQCGPTNKMQGCSWLVMAFRSYLYLGSFLGSALFYLSIASLVNIFLRAQLLFDFVLWGGLFMSLG